MENTLISWPMNILTKKVGDSRKLKCHPRRAISNSGYVFENGSLVNIKQVAIKLPNGTYHIEVKEQGHRYFYSRDHSGVYYMNSRRVGVDGTYGNLFDKVDRKRIALPEIEPGTVLDCELIYPGHPDSEVPTAIKEFPEKLKLKVFAAPFVNGKDNRGLSYEDGKSVLLKLIDSINLVEYKGKIELNGNPAVLCNLLRLAKEQGVEGFVLKSNHYSGWWKLKTLKEADVFVTGFKVSQSATLYGLISSVNVSVMGVNGRIPMGSVSGFDRQEMINMTSALQEHGDNEANPYVNKVMRVMYQEMASKGKLKHAFFDCWREDKSYNDCNNKQFD